MVAASADPLTRRLLHEMITSDDVRLGRTGWSSGFTSTRRAYYPVTGPLS
jgi:hypothetical protein